VSKQDTKFQNTFAMVLGLLVAIAIALFALARVVGQSTQMEQLKQEKLQHEAVQNRTAPFAAGQDNSALKVEESSGPAPAAAALPTSGEQLFNMACTACHGAGIGGAPKMGDKAAWGPRIAQGKDTLYKHALQGLQGNTGIMPPKGGRVDLPDDVIKMGVDYMVEHSQ
jgi:cytochrome c5